MDPSSLIFVVIIAIWAAYLLGHWVRRRDQLATARSIDRFSDAMRVLERRAPVPAVTAARPATRAYVMTPVRPPTVGTPARTSAPTPARARAAAVRRRTRILAALVAATPASWLVVVLTAVPWWVAAVPTLALVGLVVRLRRTARRQSRRRQRHATVRRRAAARAGRESVRSVVGQVVAARGERLAEATQRAAESLSATRPAELALEPAPVENGWQPVPVPPPTYTLKPKATPVVRPQAPARPVTSQPVTAQPVTSQPVTAQLVTAPEPQPAVTFDLDEILERRIASGA